MTTTSSFSADRTNRPPRSLSSGYDENSGLKQENAELSNRLENLSADRHEIETALKDRDAEAKRLATRTAGLEEELAAVSAALRQAEEDRRAQEAEIHQLSQRLKTGGTTGGLAAAPRAVFSDQLALRLAGTSDVRQHEGQLLLQSDMLFAKGSATLDAAGKDQLRRLAKEILAVAQGIPASLSWMIRVEGHTDSGPVQSEIFRTHWRMSIARTVAVVEFLVLEGVPSEWLEAAGFGALRPIDTSDDEIAARRNRRVAFYLTEG